MELRKLIHKKTWAAVEGYLSMDSPSNLILSGISGLGKYDLGIYISSQILGCSTAKLLQNPDFYLVGQDRNINVEDITQLIEFSQRTSVKNKKVLLINHAHTITVSSQNKLLKILEDRPNNILIFLEDTNTLIPTVKSRCNRILLHPLNEKEMAVFLKEQGIPDTHIGLIAYLLDNAPYLFLREKELISTYESKFEDISKIKVRADLLKVMNTMKEKDRKNFYEINSDRTAWNIKLILYPFYNYFLKKTKGISSDEGFPSNLYTVEEAYKILSMGQCHLSKTNYTKNDYFDLLRYIVQAE